MNQFGIVVFGLLTVAALFMSFASSASVPVIFCQPGALNEASPKERQLCIALLGRMDFSSEEAAQNDPTLVARGTKRQDIDHVFLRFGRRLDY